MSAALKRALGFAIVGAIGLAIAFAIDAPRAAASYLVAYTALLGVALGALALVMIARVTAANWFVALRRQAEQVAATLPAFAILFVPVLLSIRVLYPWTSPDTRLAPAARALVRAKAAYLNTPFFIVRAIIYFALWILIEEALRRTSLAQDAGDTRPIERRMYALSAGGLVAFAFATSFAAFDWLMSLGPTWFSTIYGVDYFAGAMVGALALLTILVAAERRTGTLPPGVGADHVHALAKLLLTFVLFWVYIGFSQLIVIWSAEIPVERVWYAVRMRGGWKVLGGVVLLGHFALPFCALLVRSIKRSPLAMAAIGLGLLAMHYLDVYWIAMPDAPFHGGWGFACDAAALLFVGGVAAATWSVRRSDQAPVAAGDPRLAASLQYSVH